MPSRFTVSLVCLMFILIHSACNLFNDSPPPLNPNGDSELALLMRAMFEDGEQMKKQLESGLIPTSKIDHTKILTAKPTDEEQRGKPEYESFAGGYLQIVESLKSANEQTSLEIHKNMVDMCISCHKSLCPGPIVRIEQLYLDK